MATRGSAIGRVILWLFVIAVGIGVGAGLYELRVITPLWAGSPPESVWGWRDLLAANPTFAPHGGERFWIIVTPARALLALAVLVTAFQVHGAQRTWRLIAGSLGLVLFAIAALGLIPLSTELFASTVELAPEAVVAGTITYVTLNYVLQLVGFAAFLAALRALSLPSAALPRNQERTRMTRHVVALAAAFALTAAPVAAQIGDPVSSSPERIAGREGGATSLASSNPDWWKSGVCYEIFVRSFQDGDGDGVGDFRGLTERLDYINDGDPATTDDLGATCVWLMPIMPSPSYHSYDVTNYFDVQRDYGTLDDFRAFLDAAHERGIHVLIDLVLNHISSEHPYFRDALIDVDSPYRDWFVWADEPRPHPGWEAPVWHRVQRGPDADDVEYYYGLFWGGMPDYNLTNPAVKAEIERIVNFWANDVGVDGFRLDAIGHLFEGPGGQWKNAPQNFPWLREFRDMLERVAPDVFTVGEVYDNHEGVRVYYPDMLHTFFAFELADSLISAVRHGNAAGVAYIADRVQDDIPDQRWGVFLRNHDQTRTLTDMGGDVARVRLAAALQLTLPGLPFVYYGEELGMTGNKRDGDIRLRTPMAWSREPGVGFTDHIPWEPLPSDSLTANVVAQDTDPSSMLNHYRRLIQLRTSNEALQTGEFIPLDAGNRNTLAYLRRADDGSAAVVVANLSEQPLASARVSSSDDALREGRYVPRVVFGGGTARNMTVGRDGRISGWTMSELGPLEVRVIALTRHN